MGRIPSTLSLAPLRRGFSLGVNLLLEEGDPEGSAVWRRILAAIEELRRQMWKGEKANLGPGKSRTLETASIAATLKSPTSR